MKPNHAEICRVGKLEPNFQQLPLVQFFLNFHNIVLKRQYSLRQKLKKKKTLYYRNCIGQTNFWL